MALSSTLKKEIAELLGNKIDSKLAKYLRESSSMPFLIRLIQDAEKVASYSFIHSIATSLGMSIYEQVSVIVARNNSTECFRNHGLGGVLSRSQKSVINNIITELRNNERKPDHKREVEEVLKASTRDGKYQKDGNIADFYMKRDGVEYFFEIKTVKPNIDVFAKSKAKLLEWVARKRSSIKVFLAFPYNPYYPQPYARFTMQNLLDSANELLVGEQYWDLLGGKGAYQDILDTFDKTGKIYKEKIANKIKEVARVKMNS